MGDKLNNIDKSVENEDLTERAKIIVDQANTLFNRLQNNIFSLKSRVTTFFGIIIAILALQVTLLQPIYRISGLPLNVYIMFIVPFLILMIISAFIINYIFWSTKYCDIDLFEEDRYNEVISATSQELLLDFLYEIRKDYLHNYSKYITEIKWFRRGLITFTCGILYIITFIIGDGLLFMNWGI